MTDSDRDDVTVDQLRCSAKAFIAEAIADGVACPAFGVIMPPALFEQARAWQRHCDDHGFSGIDWPLASGGHGRSGAHAAAWNEECARAGVAPYMNFQGIVLAGGAIRRFGTEEQQSRYLAPTLRADIVWCQLFSEPGSGSDLVSLSTRAVPTGDGWLVTGQKLWSSTAQLAQRAILLARTNDDDPGHRGISFFLFDMEGPGVDVRPLRQMTGDSEFCEVFLDEAPIVAADLLGPLHGGWTVATSVLSDERAEVGAAGIGLERRLAGLPANGRFAAVQVEGRAVAGLLDRSNGDPSLGPLTKLAMTELDGRITSAVLDARGADGMLVGPATEPFLYSPGMRVAGGTSEIQRNLIGERLLGLPREPRLTT
ncbi:MAG: acyl-CoA dehydrogenase family protein [Ilumatobacteraceae bacterium]